MPLAGGGAASSGRGSSGGSSALLGSLDRAGLVDVSPSLGGGGGGGGFFFGAKLTSTSPPALPSMSLGALVPPAAKVACSEAEPGST